VASGDNNSHDSVGFCGALFLVFLVLKLTHIIDWSWWWITAPLWIPSVLVAVLITVVVVARKGDR
jgi:hypothetical protein